MTQLHNTHSDLTYFAIVGVGRSGTSLLMTMLDSHPQLALPPETQFIFRHVARLPRASIEQLRGRIENEVNFSRLGFDLDEYFLPFTEGNRKFSMAAAYRRILEMWSEQTGVLTIGDKSPKNVEYLPIVKAIYPDARIIHIVRDPRDVFLSRTKAKWCSGRHRLAHTLAYRTQFDLGRRQGQLLFGENYLEVSYERLLSEPASELTRICSLLDVKFDSCMLDRSSSAESHVFPEELDWKREVLGPLLTTNSQKWKTQLSDKEIAYIEDCCATSFGPLAYTAVCPDVRRRLTRQSTRMQMSIMSCLYRCFLALRNRAAAREFDLIDRASDTQSASQKGSATAA